MRWFLGLLGRFLLFWSLWGCGSVALLALVSDLHPSGDDAGFLGRLVLFCSATALLALEALSLRRALRGLERALREAGREPLAGRRSAAILGCLIVFFASGFWALALVLFSTRLREVDDGGALLLQLGLGTVGWAGASLLLIWVVLGGFSRLRLRVGARGLALPRLPVTMPWLVASWCGLAYLLAFFGLPDPRIVAALGAAAVAATPAEGQGEVELLVELGPDDDIHEIEPLLQATGAQAARAVPDIRVDEDLTLAGAWVLSVPRDRALALALLLGLDDENVTNISLNIHVSADPLRAGGACREGGIRPTVDDPYAPAQVELARILAWDLLAELRDWTPVRPALIAVIDSGVTGTEPDLSMVLRASPDDVDRVGHGTAVASLAGAVANNGRGIASFNRDGRFIKLLSLPALARPWAGADDVADAIAIAIDQQADVINLSFGAPGNAPLVVRAAVARAIQRGVVVVASAGNDGASARDSWPANLPGVLVVGATAATGLSRASFSNRTDGVALAVSAPGEGVCAASARGGYARVDGTSMAAPLVSGLVGLMKAVCPGLTPDEAASLLMRTGTALPPGEGLGPQVNALAALAALRQERADCRSTTLAPARQESEDLDDD